MPKQNILLATLPLTCPNMPPIGSGFLQAFLTQNGIDANIIDFNHAVPSLKEKLNAMLHEKSFFENRHGVK